MQNRESEWEALESHLVNFYSSLAFPIGNTHVESREKKWEKVFHNFQNLMDFPRCSCHLSFNLKLDFMMNILIEMEFPCLFIIEPVQALTKKSFNQLSINIIENDNE